MFINLEDYANAKKKPQQDSATYCCSSCKRLYDKQDFGKKCIHCRDGVVKRYIPVKLFEDEV